MKILITGICGFVGSSLALAWRSADPDAEIIGLDNFVRAGSEVNRQKLAKMGIRILHVDIRTPSDFEALPNVDWVIDSAANSTVLAGIDGYTSSRQLVEHNLFGTINILEYCKRCGAGFILISTSRVYSIAALSELKVETVGAAFRPANNQELPYGISSSGIAETFSTAAPVSLYGSSKLASEALALEYGEAFGFPVWINRCGVMAGAGQFGRPDQGIFAFWINAWIRSHPLKYIGFGGKGYQVRDCMHPNDLIPLIRKQVSSLVSGSERLINLGGGNQNSISLYELSCWCSERFGRRIVESQHEERRFDIPWLVLDTSLAEKKWGWRPATHINEILEEIAAHAERNPDWLEISGVL
ncbi:MAG: NAD-dependent epimerase/dehydratase family protein [Desulfuromonadaceae bacterium]|nr:NAD-dependent epimerase/dehydratase family protein [Desulfuromonadaceae bacterium]MDD2854919.1 NAD-dependent epimerase/dehydratase family protein [Desulfuromonadaceae bacterium]